MSSDVAEVVGQWAEGVENRSLLHEKFSLPKVWDAPDDRKIDDAGRWNILRIVENGRALLEKDSQDLKWEVEKAVKHGDADKENKKRALAKIVSGMAQSGRIANSFSDLAKSKSEALEKDLKATYGDCVATFPATLAARMMINMAGGVVENAGISLDRLLGLPFIPGSAAKGIARQQALWDIHDSNAEEKERLLQIALLAFGFGSHDVSGDFQWAGGALAKKVAQQIDAEEFKGCVAFLPAYPLRNCRVVVDMVNPHYPRYYSGKADTAQDTENPIPNFFPAVESGAVFQFSVVAHRESALIDSKEMLDQVQKWLSSALSNRGLGAKTAAGYGWFHLGASSGNASTQPTAASVPAPLISPEDQLIQKWSGKLNAAGNFPVALPEIEAVGDTAVLKKIFEAIIPESERRRLVSNPKWKNQPYWQSFLNGKHTESAKKILTRLGYLK
jgi:CRISPR type III-B/RAMP module RAMP protein Cmr6